MFLRCLTEVLLHRYTILMSLGKLKILYGVLMPPTGFLWYCWMNKKNLLNILLLLQLLSLVIYLSVNLQYNLKQSAF